MEVRALVHLIRDLTGDVEKARIEVVSRAARLDEFLGKTRHMPAIKIDPLFELSVHSVRRDMRELLQDVEAVAARFESLHAPTGAKNEALLAQASRLLANVVALHRLISNLSANARQAHNILRSSNFGVVGWHVQHDADEAEDRVRRMMKTCQRLSTMAQMEEGPRKK